MRDLLQRHIGSHRIGRYHEYDGVGAADERLDTLPPILKGVDFGAIDKWFKAAGFQRGFEPIGKSHVLARIGNEDFGPLNLGGRAGIRGHRRVPWFTHLLAH